MEETYQHIGIIEGVDTHGQNHTINVYRARISTETLNEPNGYGYLWGTWKFLDHDGSYVNCDHDASVNEFSKFDKFTTSTGEKVKKVRATQMFYAPGLRSS